MGSPVGLKTRTVNNILVLVFILLQKARTASTIGEVYFITFKLPPSDISEVLTTVLVLYYYAIAINRVVQPIQ